MTDDRLKYSVADHVALTTQVNGKCPLCGVSLFYKKKSRSFKGYELAHIYPLNPTPDEDEELKDEIRLHPDVNHPDNLIPLCTACHTIFDKPRTAAEYRKLAAIKRGLIERAANEEIQLAYQLEADISHVVDCLYTLETSDLIANIEYNIKRLSEKFDDTIPIITQQKITHNVTDFYPFIKSRFLEMERKDPTVSDLISTQVKSYYLKQKSLGLSQHEIFSHIVSWINSKTSPQTIEAAEIVTSFFIQNCEVF